MALRNQDFLIAAAIAEVKPIILGQIRPLGWADAQTLASDMPSTTKQISPCDVLAFRSISSLPLCERMEEFDIWRQSHPRMNLAMLLIRENR